MTDELRERLARALFRSDAKQFKQALGMGAYKSSGIDTWPFQSEDTRDGYLMQVDAILSEIAAAGYAVVPREPSFDAVEEGLIGVDVVSDMDVHQYPCLTHQSAKAVFKAVLKASEWPLTISQR